MSSNSASSPKGKRTAPLTLAALGVVYGDIGTSPLYTVRECFSEFTGLQLTPDNILGILSMITWALIIVVTLKYVLVVMRADNRGEGGVLALMALMTRRDDVKARRRRIFTPFGRVHSASTVPIGSGSAAMASMGATEAAWRYENHPKIPPARLPNA